LSLRHFDHFPQLALNEVVMKRHNDVFASRRVSETFVRSALSRVQPQDRGLVDDRAELNAIAEAEGWRVPRPEVTRVVLRPWQQAVFWGLRVYIAVLLAIIAAGFAQFAAGK
jgi:hypothetical protein